MTVWPCTADYISRWKGRFEHERLGGLYARHRGSASAEDAARIEARVLARTQKAPGDGSTHWSTRKLGKALGISHMMVARIWAKHGLKPHRLERYMASNDPQFEAKAAEVIGLYLNPPAHAAVFCVDEKTAIQALDRLDPVLPLSPGRLERHGFEFTSVADLKRKLMRYIRQYNRAPKPVKWVHRNPAHRITTDSRVTVH